MAVGAVVAGAVVVAAGIIVTTGASGVVPRTVVVVPVMELTVVEVAGARVAEVLEAAGKAMLVETVPVFVGMNGFDEVLATFITLTTVVETVVVAVAQCPAVETRTPFMTRMQYEAPVTPSVVSTPFFTVAFSASRVCVCMSAE